MSTTPSPASTESRTSSRRSAWLRLSAARGESAQKATKCNCRWLRGGEARHVRQLVERVLLGHRGMDLRAVPTDSGEAGVRIVEGAIAGDLIGELELFPDADMDTVLDVRERLKTARVHLRAATRAAAEELRNVPKDQPPDAVAGVRRKLVDGASRRYRRRRTRRKADPLTTQVKGRRVTAIATASIRSRGYSRGLLLTSERSSRRCLELERLPLQRPN